MPGATGDLPPEASAQLARIKRTVPAAWHVSRTWIDANDCWIAELTDERGQPMAEVVLWPTQESPDA
jgi:hypothetical protein